MSIVPLKKLMLVGMAADKEPILSDLQEFGCLHLIPLTLEGEESSDQGPSKEAKEALEFLASCPQKRRQVTDAERFEALEVELKALEIRKRLHDLRQERDDLDQRIEFLEPWGEFEFPSLEDLGGNRLWFYVVPLGQMNKIEARDLIWQEITRNGKDCYIVVISPGEPENMPVTRVRSGARSLRKLKSSLEEIELELEDTEAERQSLTRWCTLLARSLDGLDDGAARAQAAAQTFDEDPLFALEAWIPNDRLGDLESYASRQGLALEVMEAAPTDEPPTWLENPPALTGGQDLVLFYRTPAYSLWDPSSIVLISFAIFFAMILSDFGYGALLGLITLLSWKTMGLSDSGRHWRINLVWLTSTSMLYGALVGSYFGLTPPAGSFLSRFHILDLNNFMMMMNLTITIGALHLILANIKVAMSSGWRPKSLVPFGWACFITGGLLLYGSMMIDGLAAWPGQVLLAGGLLLAMFYSGHGAPTIGQRIALGLLAIPRVSNAFGDVLSYLRLFALGLASASLAISFNNMASGIREAVPGIGLLFALVVLLLGHALNLVLAIASGFIHGLRLNVIEFFNWGVQEEGNLYRPFKKKEGVSWNQLS
jgi:V/A-type H+-transporting ATPase subunit I